VLDEKRKHAEEDYTEIFEMFRKLDEVRFTMNKQMGPGGPMAPESRKKFLDTETNNLDDHDALLENQGYKPYEQNQPMLD
jgi:hypothetical protein